MEYRKIIWILFVLYLIVNQLIKLWNYWDLERIKDIHISLILSFLSSDSIFYTCFYLSANSCTKMPIFLSLSFWYASYSDVNSVSTPFIFGFASWEHSLLFSVWISCSILRIDLFRSEFIKRDSSLNYFLLFSRASFLVSKHFLRSFIYLSRSLYLCSHYFNSRFARFNSFVNFSISPASYCPLFLLAFVSSAFVLLTFFF